MARIGRPMRYGEIIHALDDQTLYSPALIASLGVDIGLIEGETVEEVKINRGRCRHALGRLVINHSFPDEGDGLVSVPGQAPTPGWFGWRFKETLS